MLGCCLGLSRQFWVPDQSQSSETICDFVLTCVSFYAQCFVIIFIHFCVFLCLGIQFETYMYIGRYYNKIKQTYQTLMKQQQDNQDKSLTKYFTKYNKLIKTNPKLPVTEEVENKIEKLINQGTINVEPITQQKLNGADTGRSIKLLSKQIEQKKNQFNKELMLLNMSLSRSAYLIDKKNSSGSQVKSVRMVRTRTDVSQEDYQQYQKKRVSSDRRLKQLKKMKNDLVRKKSSIQLQKQKQRQQKQSIQKQIQRAKIQLQKNAKLNKINERMKKLEESRVSRLDTLKNSCVRSTNSIPKYKIMRYRFDCNEIDYQLEQKERLRNKNVQKLIEYSREKIKEHQEQYNKKLKTIRHGMKTEVQPQLYRKREAEFNLIRNPQKINQKFQQNKLKAKLYEDKITQIRNVMTIDPQIGKQFQVAKDKAKHPFKYHYLKLKKNISDMEIYENYSHFNFNAHPVQLGNFYLDEINKKNRALINKNSGSTSKRSKTDGSTSEQKIVYKNYLDEARKRQKTQTKKQDEVEQLLKRYGSKSKVIEVLQNKAQIHKNNSLKKIEKMKKFDTYTNTLKLQKEVDDEFINSIKTKLKCFQVS